MEKELIEVTPLKSTKLDGELVKANKPIKVTKDQRGLWLKTGVLSDEKVSSKITVDVKVDEKLLSKCEKLETENLDLKSTVKKLQDTLTLKAMTIKEVKELVGDKVNLNGVTGEDNIINAVIESGFEIPTTEQKDLLG